MKVWLRIRVNGWAWVVKTHERVLPDGTVRKWKTKEKVPSWTVQITDLATELGVDVNTPLLVEFTRPMRPGEVQATDWTADGQRPTVVRTVRRVRTHGDGGMSISCKKSARVLGLGPGDLIGVEIFGECPVIVQTDKDGNVRYYKNGTPYTRYDAPPEWLHYSPMVPMPTRQERPEERRAVLRAVDDSAADDSVDDGDDLRRSPGGFSIVRDLHDSKGKTV